MQTFQELYYYRPAARKKPETVRADLCVYGGTSAGVVAALQAARMGKCAQERGRQQ